MKRLKIIFHNKATELPTSFFPEKTKVNLISNLYYDTDWWKKPIAIEWWQRDGHFNEELYRRTLSAKLDAINNLK